METRLFEAMSKCRTLTLDGAVEDLKDLDGIAKVGDYEYSVKTMNEKLQSYKTGWTKYSLFTFGNKLAKTNNKNIRVLSILHLIHASESDIIIWKVVKYSPTNKKTSIRYILMQGAKYQQCNNLKELYQCMTRSYNYEGRVLLVKDFVKDSNNG